MRVFRTRPIRLAGPFGLAIASYRLWRRFAHRRDNSAQSVEDAAPLPVPAPPDEVVAAELTSPGTVSDPKLEERRAAEAVARERESRASTLTKFDELRLEQESERHEHAAAVAELDLPDESS